jgi:uncharacterized protein
LFFDVQTGTEAQLGDHQRRLSQRIFLLDALRAFGMFGLLLVHCVLVFELLHGVENPPPSALRDWVMWLFAGKSYAVFAFCFGVSFFLIMDNAERRGQSYWITYLWRLALLAGFGLLHTMIYRGDILMLLALVGALLLPVHRIQSNTVLLVLAFVLLANLPLTYHVFAGLDGQPWAQAMPLHWSDPAVKIFIQDSFFNSVWANLGLGNLHKWQFYRESGRLYMIPGLCILGILAGRLRYLHEPERHMRWTAIGLVVTGLLATILYANTDAKTIFGPFAEGDMTFVYIEMLIGGWANNMFTAFQIFAFVLLWQLLSGRFLRALAPVGQMTLTFYIGQSLVFLPLVSGYGLGLYDDLSQVQLFVMGLVVFFIQIPIAHWWLARFRQGPLEWLWRSLTDRRMAPLRVAVST